MSDSQTRVHFARRTGLVSTLLLLALTVPGRACPDLQATRNLPGAQQDLAVQGTLLLTGGSMLRLFSLAQPALPEPLDSLQLDFQPVAIAGLDGERRFVVLGSDRLVTVDFPLAGPASQEGELQLTETATCLATTTGQAWVGLEAGGILPVGLADPASPQPGERLDTPGSTLDLLYHNGKVIAGDDSSLRLYNAVAGGELALVSQVVADGTGMAELAARGTLLVCRQRNNGIRIYDITNAASPQQRSHLNQYLALNSTREMAFAGNDLLLAGRYLFAYDLAQPNLPDLLGITATRNLAGRALDVLNSRAYVLSSQDGATVSHLEVFYANCNPEADYAFDLEADHETEVGLNGGTAVFELSLENLGEYPGHYQLTLGASPWPASLHQVEGGAPLDSIPGLEPNQTFDFELWVEVPEDPEVYTRQVVLTAQSVEDPDRSRTLNLIVQGSCRRLDELPGRLEHENLPTLTQLGDGEWLAPDRLAWLAPEIPAILLIDAVEGTLTQAPLPLPAGNWRGIGWHEASAGFWCSREDSLIHLDGSGAWLGAVSAPELWPVDGGRVAGISVDEPGQRLWVLLDGTAVDKAFVYDLSSGQAQLVSQTTIDWNLDPSAGLSGLDYEPVSHQMLTFGRAGGELECLTDIGGGLVSARGDFCPGGIDSPAGLALSGEGLFYTPFLDGQFFRLRRYEAPCLFAGLDPGYSTRPDGFALQAVPNPFNPSTTLHFELPGAGEVDLAVYNLGGQRVAELLAGPLGAGHHQVAWQARGMASGVYLVRLAVQGGGQAREHWSRILLLK